MVLLNHSECGFEIAVHRKVFVVSGEKGRLRVAEAVAASCDQSMRFPHGFCGTGDPTHRPCWRLCARFSLDSDH